MKSFCNKAEKLSKTMPISSTPLVINIFHNKLSSFPSTIINSCIIPTVYRFPSHSHLCLVIVLGRNILFFDPDNWKINWILENFIKTNFIRYNFTQLKCVNKKEFDCANTCLDFINYLESCNLLQPSLKKILILK